MAYDVFISYSSKNTEIATRIYESVKTEDVSCWMAPTDIPGGSEYEDMIVNVIENCKIVVLVFSEPASVSRWVNSEISIAFSEYKHIIPFKIDDTEIKGKMRVKLNDTQIIDARKNQLNKINELVSSIKILLNRSAEELSTRSSDSTKTLSFIQNLDYESACNYMQGRDYSEALDIFLRFAIGGNVESQEKICEIMYRLSSDEANRVQLRKLDTSIYNTVSAIATEGKAWANFVMHCYNYNKNHEESLRYLLRSFLEAEIGLAYLRLGIAYEWGLSVKANVEHAEKCYMKALEHECIYAYSYMAQHCRLVKQDKDMAIAYAKKGVDSHDERSYGQLCSCYYECGDYKAHEDLLKSMLKENYRSAYYYYGDYYLGRWNEKNIEVYKDKAIKYLEIALKSQEYRACGSLALYYYNQGDFVKSRLYAEEGVKKFDSFSSTMMYYLEIQDDNYAAAWDAALERWNLYGTGGDLLGELYLDKGYRPEDFSIYELVRILEICSMYSHQCCNYLVRLYTEDEFAINDPVLARKYKKLAADSGEVEDAVEYGMSLMDMNSEDFDPIKGETYLTNAIQKGNAEASKFLLEYWKEADNPYFLNEKRNLVLAKKAYHLNDDFFELLYPTDVDAENVDSFMDFLVTIIDSYNEFSEQNKNKAKAKLLIESYKSGWKLSESVREDLLNEARFYALNDPMRIKEYRAIFDVLFPDFDLSHPSLEEEWFNLYYNTREFSEYEAIAQVGESMSDRLSVAEDRVQKEIKQNLNDLYMAMDNFWTSYKEIFTDLELEYEVQVPVLPDSKEDLYSYSGNQLIQIKRDMVSGILSVCNHPQVFKAATVGDYLSSDDESKLNIAEKEKNVDLQLLLIEHVEVRYCVDAALSELAKL